MAEVLKQGKVSLAEYAAKHNPKKTRRNKRMSESYLYRLIRQAEAGEATRPLWFDYVLEGEKDRIYILL
jgi:hypothetical protein